MKLLPFPSAPRHIISYDRGSYCAWTLRVRRGGRYELRSEVHFESEQELARWAARKSHLSMIAQCEGFMEETVEINARIRPGQSAFQLMIDTQLRKLLDDDRSWLWSAQPIEDAEGTESKTRAWQIQGVPRAEVDEILAPLPDPAQVRRLSFSRYALAAVADWYAAGAGCVMAAIVGSRVLTVAAAGGEVLMARELMLDPDSEPEMQRPQIVEEVSRNLLFADMDLRSYEIRTLLLCGEIAEYDELYEQVLLQAPRMGIGVVDPGALIAGATPQNDPRILLAAGALLLPERVNLLPDDLRKQHSFDVLLGGAVGLSAALLAAAAVMTWSAWGEYDERRQGYQASLEKFRNLREHTHLRPRGELQSLIGALATENRQLREDLPLQFRRLQPLIEFLDPEAFDLVLQDGRLHFQCSIERQAVDSVQLLQIDRDFAQQIRQFDSLGRLSVSQRYDYRNLRFSATVSLVLQGGAA